MKILTIDYRSMGTTVEANFRQLQINLYNKSYSLYDRIKRIFKKNATIPFTVKCHSCA